MRFQTNRKHRLSMSDPEAHTFSRIVVKIAKPPPGLTRVEFEEDEAEFISMLYDIFGPDDEEK